jgi:hypothetical protein
MAAGDPIPLFNVAPEPEPPTDQQVDALRQRCAAAGLDLIQRPADEGIFDDWGSSVVRRFLKRALLNISSGKAIGT